MRRALVALAALGMGIACGGRVGDVRPQWLVTVHTDAPIPQFGDRILVEILQPNGDPACTGCRRLFGARTTEDWPISFGLPDEGGATRLLRVRLFRSDQSDSGGAPRSDLVIDDVSTLPPTGGGVRPVDVVLSLACAGVAPDVTGSRSCDSKTSTLAPRTASVLTGPAPKPGSAPDAVDVPCPRGAPPGMVCVPGGLFARGSRATPSPIVKITPERLVRLSPFALDEHEFTVGEARALVDAGKLTVGATYSTNRQGCTFTRSPDDKEDYPLTCVTFELAQAVCAARGLRLPTEAEWEFAAGNRTRETRFPWGDDPDACPRSTVGVARIPFADPSSPDPTELSTTCRSPDVGVLLPWGPTAVGTTDDVTDLGIHDLGGNVHEWTSDAFEPYDGPCSAGPHVLVDPKCPASVAGTQVVRGAGWGDLPVDAEVTRRLAVDRAFVLYDTFGVRCATGF